MSLDAVDYKPNIIFIMADDLGYRDLGCYGQDKIKTPNIDKMATEGISFLQCYSGSPVCAPSRSVLMTGQHTGHTRVRDNFALVGGFLVTDYGPPQKRVTLQAEDVTVSEILKEAGYHTCMSGKWGLGEEGSPGIPNIKGFDEFFGYLNQRRAHSYYPPFLWHNKEKKVLEGNLEGKQTQYSHDMITDFALEYIRKHKDDLFFLYLPYCLPHDKFEIPSVEPYENQPWSRDEKVFAAMVSLLDRDVGRIIALLKTLKIDEKTIVFFCSDNGATRPEEWGSIFNSTGVFRAGKGDLYEGGIRVPMIVRWPNKIPAGTVNNAVWYFADFLPTATALANIQPPQDIDGVNILPTLLGGKQQLEKRFLYWEHHGVWNGHIKGFRQAVRTKNWKAVREGVDSPLELYDLASDLSERNDVSKQRPDIVRRIEEYLETARTESEYWPV